MDIQFQTHGPEHWHAEILLAFTFENENPCPTGSILDQSCPWLAIAPALKDYKAKKGDNRIIYGHPDLNIPRVLLLGLGKREDATPEILRNATAEALQICRRHELASAILPEPMLGDIAGGRTRLLEECVCAAILGLYRFTQLKKNQTDILADPKWLAIGFAGEEFRDSGQLAARRGENSALAVCLARDLDNTPANLLYPEIMALRAASLAQEHGFSCQIMDENRLAEEGMGCLLAVGQGSSHPPRLIILEYAPKGSEQTEPLVLVGKGITFDSGGICLKPPANMYQMKCDMSGAAAVLAVVDRLAQEKTEQRVIGILACAENLPGGHAFRPGDVLISCAGDSVEVINTDAEGRLALCDALAYAQKKWSPKAIIDVATLTGACAVALGNGLAGLFCNDADLSSRIRAFGKSCGENFWQLPLWQPYEEALKSNIADICHTASREGGAITAALFLKHFIKAGQLWAHLDIAGVDWNGKQLPLCPEGATAFATRTLLELGRGGLA